MQLEIRMQGLGMWPRVGGRGKSSVTDYGSERRAIKKTQLTYRENPDITPTESLTKGSHAFPFFML